MATTVFFLKEADFLNNTLELHIGAAEGRRKRAQELIERGAYEKVAEVDGSPEDAFRLMQNGVVTDSWTLEPPEGLTVCLPPREGRGHRSMSVGDIVVEDGEVSICAPFGFEAVGVCSEAIAQKLAVAPNATPTPKR